MPDQLIRDLAYSAAALLRDRSFTLTTVATLTVALSLVTSSSRSSTPTCSGPMPSAIRTFMRDSMGRAAEQANRRGPCSAGTITRS